MYNRLYKYLNNLKISYQNNSISKRTIQLIMHYCNLLTKLTNFWAKRIGVFIDLDIDDLQFASDLLDPIMFANDTNLLDSINTGFLKVNDKLQKISEWFIFRKLSLNVKKANTRFYKNSVLPKLNINNCEIARTESIKFLGVMLDENLSWKTHIKCIENKISKNIRVLFKARPFLNKKSILSL